MVAEPDDFLTVNVAARLLGVSATTVRNWAREGRLEELRTPGGHRRFRAADVHQLAHSNAPSAGPLVLVVDDDEAVRYLLREVLTAAGFEVAEAPTGLLGLDALDQRMPALMVLDIVMPGVDGFQVMRYLEQFGVRLPVLVMSALGHQAEQRAFELGADVFVTKPFDPRELVLRARRLIDAEQVAAGPS